MKLTDFVYIFAGIAMCGVVMGLAIVVIHFIAKFW
jgi:hypothetical protein